MQIAGFTTFEKALRSPLHRKQGCKIQNVLVQCTRPTKCTGCTLVCFQNTSPKITSWEMLCSLLTPHPVYLKCRVSGYCMSVSYHSKGDQAGTHWAQTKSGRPRKAPAARNTALGGWVRYTYTLFGWVGGFRNLSTRHVRRPRPAHGVLPSACFGHDRLG